MNTTMYWEKKLLLSEIRASCWEDEEEILDEEKLEDQLFKHLK